MSNAVTLFEWVKQAGGQDCAIVAADGSVIGTVRPSIVESPAHGESVELGSGSRMNRSVAITADVQNGVRQPINIRFDALLLERLDAHADAIRRTRTEVIHRAIEEYLTRQNDTAPKSKKTRK